MALETIQESILEELQPQVETVAAEMMKKVAVLVGKKVQSGPVKLQHGSYDDFYRKNRAHMVMTKIAWDTQEGGLYFMSTKELAIVLAAYLLGKPENIVKDKVQNADFDEELVEVFNEVSNQICGIYNQVIAEMVDGGIHLTLKETMVLPANGSKNSKVDADYFYLFASIPVTVEGGFTFPLHLVISKNFTKKLFEIDLGEWKKEGATASSDATTTKGAPVPAGGGASISLGDFESVVASQVMISNFPSIHMKESIGEALDLMNAKGVDCLPVIEDDRVVRIVTKNNAEIIRSVFFDAPGQEERISRLMSLPLNGINEDQELISTLPDTPLQEVLDLMVQNKISYIPVLTEEQALEGVITAHSVLAMLASK